MPLSNGSKNNSLPQTSIEAFARGFYKQGQEYGFQHVDFIRFVNQLLDMSMTQNGYAEDVKSDTNTNYIPNSTLPIECEQLNIRRFVKEDASVLKKWVDDPLGRLFLLSTSSLDIMSVDQMAHDDSMVLGTITTKTAHPIGVVAFVNIDPFQKKAEIRKLIGDLDYREKGYAKEATRQWLSYGIHGLGLHKIYLNTLDTNIRNIKLNEDLGFKVEGILREEVFIDGEHRDVLRMGMCVPPKID